jgi:hypothetical protein
MIDEAVAARPGVGQRVGSAHADEVGRDTPAVAGDRTEDVAPQVGRGRVAMQEHDRRAGPGLPVGHPQPVDLGVT